MKTLPSLRARKRYLLFRARGVEQESKEEVRRAFFTSLLSISGALDASRSQARLISFAREAGILVCTPESVDACIVALVCMKKVNKADAFVDVEGVFGTLKKLKEVASW